MTMIVYMGRQRKNAHKITPTEGFYRDDKGKVKMPTHGQWQELAKAIAGEYWSFELLGDQ